MTNMYDQIATVTIDIENPVVSETSFGHILIVGPMPTGATGTAATPAAMGAYSSLSEVVAAGWSTTADPVGVAAAVAFAQNPAPPVIYIARPVTTTTGTGQDATSSTESPAKVVERAAGTDGWYVVCPAWEVSSSAGTYDGFATKITPAQLKDLADMVESMDKMMIYTETKPVAGVSTFTPTLTSATDYARTAWIYGPTTSSATVAVTDKNQFANVAWAVKWLRYQSGSETSAFKTLDGLTPSTLASTEMSALKAAHGSYYVTIGNKDLVLGGTVASGEWMDIIRFRDWLKNDMQVRVCKLFSANAKIPYTDAGIALIQNAMEESLRTGQENGGIMQDIYDEVGNVTRGFSTSVPSATEVDPVTKSQRRLTGCKFRALIGGAIHCTEITGSLTYEL